MGGGNAEFGVEAYNDVNLSVEIEEDEIGEKSFKKNGDEATIGTWSTKSFEIKQHLICIICYV